MIERFVGMAYDAKDFDCADFVCHVMRELFGREVTLPNGRPRGERGQAAVAGGIDAYGVVTTEPRDGDLVLMGREGRNGCHVGLYFHLAHEGWVLHSNSTNGCSVLHRVRELPDYGTTIKGYYTWA